jgi:predicted RNA-binding protein with PUA-like domain
MTSQYWLMKSEPNAFNIDDLAAAPKRTTFWDGVRNYQVRNMLRDTMQPGDLAFFYYSNAKPPGIIGIMEIVSKGYADATAFDPNDPHYDPKSNPLTPQWYGVEVRLQQKFKRLISLEELKQHPALKNMLLLRKGSRLSITPVTAQEWNTILALESA